MSAPRPIVIAVPRYVTIPRIKQEVVIETSKTTAVVDDDDSIDEFLVRGKKRRLDHLSWEEKFQRKKLKNRVAAQTSRDRKKAKMEEIEHSLKRMTEQNNALQRTCTIMKNERDATRARNAELEQQLAELTKRLDERDAADAMRAQSSEMADRLSGCGSMTNGSAESEFPLPQELEPQSTRRSAVDDTPSNSNSSSSKNGSSLEAMWKIIALCLLYKTCSKTSTPADLKSWPKVCSQMSSQTWQQILRHAAQELPRMKAPQSECLDEWWGPSQNSWNPAKIAARQTAV